MCVFNLFAVNVAVFKPKGQFYDTKYEKFEAIPEYQNITIEIQYLILQN